MPQDENSRAGRAKAPKPRKRPAAKRKKSALRTLVTCTIIFLVVAGVCFGASYAIDAYRQSALAERQAQVKATNEKLREQNQIAQAEYQSALSKGENIAWPKPNPEGWDIVDLSAYPLEYTYDTVVDRSALLTGGLLLVNPWHSLPADFSDAALLSLGNASNWKVAVTDANVKLFQPAVDAMIELITDATAAGLKDFIVREGYRSNERQSELFYGAMDKLSKRYSGDILMEMTKKEVNFPGTSEYQTGMSFTVALYNRDDPKVADQKFQESAQGKWMTENSWKYGLIFRFPAEDFPNTSWEDKSHKTGVSIRLNIYRYVGKAHAAVMRVLNNCCLEEYIEYLIQHPHIAVYEDGVLKYEIFRQADAGNYTFNLQVPSAASVHEFSLDNMGGVVSAFTYN